MSHTEQHKHVFLPITKAMNKQGPPNRSEWPLHAQSPPKAPQAPSPGAQGRHPPLHPNHFAPSQTPWETGCCWGKDRLCRLSLPQSTHKSLFPGEGTPPCSQHPTNTPQPCCRYLARRAAGSEAGRSRSRAANSLVGTLLPYLKLHAPQLQPLQGLGGSRWSPSELLSLLHPSPPLFTGVPSGTLSPFIPPHQSRAVTWSPT